MPTNIVEIDEPEATIGSFSDSGPEESLVTAAKNGNQEAFEILIRRHRRRILAVAMRFVRIQEGAEDIVQQRFQKAFVYLERFEGKFRFAERSGSTLLHPHNGYYKASLARSIEWQT
jgi:hypothetical protein